MLTPQYVEQLLHEFERVGVPSHERGRIYTFDSTDLTGTEMLRRLRRLPDRAGIAAVNAALCANQPDQRAGGGEAAT